MDEGLTMYRETDDKIAHCTIKFLPSGSIHVASFDTEVAVAKVFSPVDHLFHDVEIKGIGQQ